MHDKLQPLSYAVVRDFLSQAEVREIHREIAWWITQFVDSSSFVMRASDDSVATELLSQLSTLDRSTIRFVRESLSGIAAVSRVRQKIFEKLDTTTISLCNEGLVVALPYEEWRLRFWHQEAYADSRITIIFHVPLVLTNSQNGGIRVANGGPWNALMSHEELECGAHGKRLTNQDQYEQDHTQLQLNAGDLVLLDALTPHAGGRNDSPTARLFVAIRATSSMSAARHASRLANLNNNYH